MSQMPAKRVCHEEWEGVEEMKRLKSLADKGKCSHEERKTEAHSGMGVQGEMFVTDRVWFSRRGSWEEKSIKSSSKDNQRSSNQAIEFQSSRGKDLTQRRREANASNNDLFGGISIINNSKQEGRKERRKTKYKRSEITNGNSPQLSQQ